MKKITKLPTKLREAVAFHGHLCPGLLIGYRAAKAGMKRLGAGRSEDEELIAVVENNSCAVDAVQVLTGATFGKGNLFFRDYGKQVFTFARRPSEPLPPSRWERPPGREGRGRETSPTNDGLPDKNVGPPVRAIRVSLKADAFGPDTPTREERKARLLKDKDDQLFTIQEIKISLPPEAEIHQSLVCAKCGEPVMETRTKKMKGKILCLPCAKKKGG